MNRALSLLGAAALGVLGCSSEGPDAAALNGPPTSARGGGTQTLYGVTLVNGLQNDPTHPFSSLGKTGDPFSGTVGGDPVYVVLPSSSGGNTAVCDQDGSGLGATTGTWGAYTGVWTGSFSVTAKGSRDVYHVSFGATHENAAGFVALVVNGTGVKSTDKLTLTFTNVRGLVSAGSTPDGGPPDAQDRCLTFSITAVPPAL